MRYGRDRWRWDWQFLNRSWPRLILKTIQSRQPVPSPEVLQLSRLVEQRLMIKKRQVPTQKSFGLLGMSDEVGWPDDQVMPKKGGRQKAWVPKELAEFERRLEQRGHSKRTAASQMRSVRSLVKAASRSHGRAVGVIELFTDVELLVKAACDPRRLDGRGSGDLADATFRGRRSGIRSFIRMMEAELGIDADKQIALFESALRDSRKLVGLLYQRTDEVPERKRRFTPSPADMSRLLELASRTRGSFKAARDVAFIALLYTTGLRLGSAIGIEGADFYWLESRLWASVREKQKDERISLRIPREAADALSRYVSAFNLWSVRSGHGAKIALASPGVFWRKSPTAQWTSQAAALMIRNLSKRIGTSGFGPHAIRRAVTQELLYELPRSDVADALRWTSVTTIDEHYGPKPGSSTRSERNVERTDDRETSVAAAT